MTAPTPFNRKAFLSEMEGMEDVLLDTINAFQETLPPLLDRIQEALSTQSLKELEIAAHTLKGMVSNFRAEPARNLALQLEVLAKETAHHDTPFAQIQPEASEIFQSLGSECVRLASALRTLALECQIIAQKTILVVDDSDFDRTLLRAALVKKGKFQAKEARSAAECLAIIEQGGVDLVLLDILMPETTGTEVLLKIREKFSPLDLPVIMVSGKSDASDVVESLRAGANDYVTKPVNFDIAVSRILMHLSFGEISREAATLKQMLASEAVVSTYHFEINRWLSVAIGCMEAPDLNLPPVRETLHDALLGIVDSLQKIKTAAEHKSTAYRGDLEFANIMKLD
ncbi:MAG: hypothetical protein RLZZ244_2920 [Verrucomicrobiota bacterium]|jgi:CheY-like chemotaxis protein